MSDNNAYRFLRPGLKLARRPSVTDPNDMIDYLSENLARLVTREMARIVKRKVARLEARGGPLTRQQKKTLARKILIKRVSSVTRKIHDELT